MWGACVHVHMYACVCVWGVQIRIRIDGVEANLFTRQHLDKQLII